MALTEAGLPDRRMLGFRGTLYRLGTNCCVDVPRRVSAALGGAFRIAVRGTMGGTGFRSTLVPRGGGRHRLFVSARAWRSLGLSEGDPIAVRLERDLVPDSYRAVVQPEFSATFSGLEIERFSGSPV